jgi:tetratricopeptide (TPR) repeat protein
MQIISRLYFWVLCCGVIPVTANAALSTDNMLGLLGGQEIHAPEYSAAVASLKASAYEEARSAAEKIVANNPNKYPGHLLLVLAYLGSENFVAIDKHLAEVERNLPQFTPSLRENLFRALRNERRYFRALAVIEDLEVERRSAQLNLDIGRVYVSQARYEDAERALSRAVAKNSELIEAHFELGRVLIIQGQYKKALDEFSIVSSTGNSSDQLHQLIGASYLGLGKYQEALQAYSRITQKNPEDVLAQLNIGIIQLYSKKYDEALTHLTASQKKDKTADSVASELLALVALNKNADARAIFDGLSPELTADPLVQLAALAIENAEVTVQSKKAIAKIFPDISDIKPGDVAFLTANADKIALAAILYKQGVYTAVTEFYAKQGAQKIHPWLGLVYARAQIKTNKIDSAIATYLDIARAYPTLVSPKLELAEAYYHQKKYAEAIDVYIPLAIEPSVERKVQLGNLYNANQQYDLAIKLYTEAVGIQPDPYMINQIAATYSERMKQPEKAVKVISDAKLTQSSPLIWDTLGWAYYNLNNIKQSLAAYKLLLAATGNNQSPETFARMARAYEKNGDTKQSRLLYEMSLNTGHEFDDKAFAQKKLAELDAGFK